MKLEKTGSESQASTDDWVQGTLLFKQWRSIKEEILLHKWYESERAGYDIGWDKASVDWMVRYGGRGRSGRSS